ncbi:hypothetical protein EVAR_92729_1 [Eumeta japonica]|uniref:Uncharacterized protein n=1 Tax=Eumeta variegata TaxID=151549 RepID=A0A4C1SX37_EUMVA|nr:hypothetical protein EVAR_92729_1 [Eumeta japonica]
MLQVSFRPIKPFKSYKKFTHTHPHRYTDTIVKIVREGSQGFKTLRPDENSIFEKPVLGELAGPGRGRRRALAVVTAPVTLPMAVALLVLLSNHSIARRIRVNLYS